MIYHLPRTAMADATHTRPGTDPDRTGFTIAWQAARDQLTQAANVIANTTIDLIGTINEGRLPLHGRAPRYLRWLVLSAARR